MQFEDFPSLCPNPPKQSMECLRYLRNYFLGCTDQCMMLKYESHQGLLHYNPEDYTLEIFSDSDWAKHRTTRRSVSSGYLFLFGNLLYSSSRSQKALALSSCEAEVYAGTSATSDAVLMYHCICFCVGPNETVKVHLALDNSAGRSFFHRSGVGKIRHISLRVLWMQQKVREKFLTVGAVSTKCNPSDLGTKRMNRDRMLYLMFPCKVFDLSTSQYVGSEVNDRMEQESVTRKGIKLFTLAGMNTHDAKALMRVMVVSALSLNPVSATPTMMVDNSSYGNFFLAAIFTILCISIGYIIMLRRELVSLRGEKSQASWGSTLMQVLDVLKKGKEKFGKQKIPKQEAGEEEAATSDESVVESPHSKHQRYMNCGMSEVSDPDLWQMWHHGVPSANDPPGDHRRFADDHMHQIMRETNELLERRRRRLEADYDIASDANDLEAMEHIDSQINECVGLMYNLGP